MIATFALLPMMRRLMENSASCVRMPARMAGMPMKVCRMPVTRPASMPARNAHSSAIQRLTPCVMRTRQTAPPVAMVPSTVRSARSSTLKVMYTPMAMRPQMSPCATAPGSEASRLEKNSTLIPPD